MKAKQLLEILGITRPTLSKYVKDGLIKIDKTIKGQHTYNKESVYLLERKQISDAIAKDGENSFSDEELTKDLLELVRSFEKKIIKFQRMKRIQKNTQE